MCLATPASASSTPLSMISQTQCMRPRVSVDPMYMPGRLRTASSPSRTRRWAALYVLSIVMLLAGTGLPEIYLRHAADECRDARGDGAYGDRDDVLTSRCGHSFADSATG